MAPRETAGQVYSAPARVDGQAVPPSPRRTTPVWRGGLGRGRGGSGSRDKDVDGDVANQSPTLYIDPTDRPPWHSDGCAPGGRRTIAGIFPTGSSQFAQPPPRPRAFAGKGKDDVRKTTSRSPSDHSTAFRLATIGLDGCIASRISVAVLAWVAGVVCTVAVCAYRAAPGGGKGKDKQWGFRANGHTKPNNGGREHDDGEEVEVLPQPIVRRSVSCDGESDGRELPDTPFHQLRDSSGLWRCEECCCQVYECSCGYCAKIEVDDGSGSPNVGRGGGGGDGGIAKRVVRGLVVADAVSRSTGQPVCMYSAAVGAIHWVWVFLIIACLAFCVGRVWLRCRTAATEHAVTVPQRSSQPSRNRRDKLQIGVPAVPETPADVPGAALRRRAPARREPQTRATSPETVADEAASMFYMHDHMHGTWPGQESSNDSEDGLPGEAPGLVVSDGTDDGEDDSGAHVAGKGSHMHVVASCGQLRRAQCQSRLSFCSHLRGITEPMEITSAWTIYGMAAKYLCCTTECSVDRHGWQRGWRHRKLSWCRDCARGCDVLLNPPEPHPR